MLSREFFYNLPTAKPLTWLVTVNTLAMCWISFVSGREINPGIVSVLSFLTPAVFAIYASKSAAEHIATNKQEREGEECGEEREDEHRH
jgi:hypothetical protein